MMIFTLAIYLANIKVFIFSNVHSNLSIFFNLGSIILYILLFLLFNSFSTSKSYNTFNIIFGTANNWFAAILAISLTMLVDIAVNRYICIHLSFKSDFVNTITQSKKISTSGIELAI